MERELFDWEGWDQHDTMLFGFTDVTLKRDIGSIKAGARFAWANISFETGVLQFGNDDVEHEFKLKLTVMEGK